MTTPQEYFEAGAVAMRAKVAQEMSTFPLPDFNAPLPDPVESPTGLMEISGMAGSWPITIRTAPHDAGAICSLTWRPDGSGSPKQFADDTDKGRQVQSSCSFDGFGEDFNPTEAGASHRTDGYNPSPSSSILLEQSSTANSLSTRTQMAFWNPVGGVKTSNHILHKHVEIGLPGLEHVIKYQTQFTIPENENHFHAVFEAVTGYMPTEFSAFWTYDPASNVLLPLSYGPGEQYLPVIISTPCKGWAMGVYSPNSPQEGWPQYGYGRWYFPHLCSKWNNVFRVNNPSGVYNFESYVIVGSLDNVRVSMRQLKGVVG